MPPGQSFGLGWCRQRKAVQSDYPLPINGSSKPPDVFDPKRPPSPEAPGSPVVSIADTHAPVYQAMLAILTKARDEALRSPRVDMPGAKIIPGTCRNLAPLTPPTPLRESK